METGRDPFGTYQVCPLCQEYGYSGMHRCKPEWEACDTSDRLEQREWERVRGVDAADAAETYCALCDKDEMVSASRTVLVRPVEHPNQIRQYVVTGELQPVYTAVQQQVENDDA